MNKRFRKFLAVLLTLVMAVTLLPALSGSADTANAANYVRIKNAWQNTYLYQSGDKVVYGNVDASNQYSQWEFIGLSDGSYRIRNRATGDYMHMENVTGYVQCGSIRDEWCSARWVKSNAGNGLIRINSFWMTSKYMHVENLNGKAQLGEINSAWSSAKWIVEEVANSQPATTQAPTTQAPTVAQTQAPAQSAAVENNTSGITIYFYANGWSSAYLWSWNGYSTNSWPGDAFTRVSGTNNWWKLTVNASQLTGYIQRTGGGDGCDRTFGTISGKGTYFVVYKNNSETLYSSQSQAESAAGENIIPNTVVTPTQPATQPATQAPTTQAPTTQAPTQAPTTQAPTTQAPTQAPVQETVANNTNGVTIYFYANGWSSAYLWSWNGYSTNSWPGDKLTKVNGTNNWWKLDINASQLTGYIQRTGGGEGCDKTFGTISGKGTYFVVYKNNSETLYNSQSQAESAAGEKISGGSASTPQPETQPSNENVTVPGTSGSGRVIGYNVPANKTRSSNVSMSVNGVEVGVFDTTVNNSHTWVGYYPPLSSARVAIFDFNEVAGVTLKVDYNVSSATIRPLADGVTPTITHSGNSTYISFQIKKAGQYSVELNGNLEDAIMIFASGIENAPSGNVIKISSGEARYGDITVGNGQTLYIEGGGALYGRVFCQSGSTVCGRGIIDQSHMDTWGGANGQYPMSIEFANNVHVKGVAVLNSSCWNYQIYNSSNVYLENIKIVSARPNGDGISIQSSSNVHVNDSFVRTWDDGVVLKNYSSNNTHDVYCDNVVFWTDLAQSMEIGVETNAGYGGVPSKPAIYNVEFTNIDVIHERHKAPISIHNGDNAEIYNVKWQNVNIEDFTPQGDGWNFWLDFTTCHPTDFGGYGGWAHHWDGTGTIHDVTLDNIKVSSGSNPQHRIWDWWASQNRGYSIYNVTCTNVTVNDSAFRY